jgi:hypothetical protein
VRGAGRLAAFLAASLAAGCGGELISGPDLPPVPPLRLEVGGTSCEGVAYYTVGTVTNEPDGQIADFPWTEELAARSGDTVRLRACNTCVLAACPVLPCDVTISVAVVWKGTVLATASSTDEPDPSCLPAVEVTATIP